MQWHFGVRSIEGLPAPMCLHVHRTARGHERGNIGDGVMDREAGLGGLDMQCLVEIACGRRVDSDQFDIRAISRGQPGSCSGARGLTLNFGGELRAHRDLSLDLLDALAHQCRLGRAPEVRAETHIAGRRHVGHCSRESQAAP